MAETARILPVENLSALDLGTEMGPNKERPTTGQTLELFCGTNVFPFKKTERRQFGG